MAQAYVKDRGVAIRGSGFVAPLQKRRKNLHFDKLKIAGEICNACLENPTYLVKKY